ncbi:MAG: hypothetical protein DRH43_11475 [Deltaproteobacteria bacterium]|nr:MAG: hypothetical protein DRH43_11475 [Deltaproteobacteria bacterium]
MVGRWVVGISGESIMTKRKLTRFFGIAVAIYGIATIVGISIRVFDKTDDDVVYSTFKDMIPFVIAMPAAWLGYCLQRRSSYLQQLRMLWSRLVEAMQDSVHYTYLDNPTEEQHAHVLRSIGISIDEVRGVFYNLNENDGNSLYPFEPLKDVYGIVRDLGHGDITPKQKRKKCREQIFALWRAARQELLKEFDREVPTFSHSHWVQPDKSDVYDEYGIEKKVT